jgi:hypothetical protein
MQKDCIMHHLEEVEITCRDISRKSVRSLFLGNSLSDLELTVLEPLVFRISMLANVKSAITIHVGKYSPPIKDEYATQIKKPMVSPFHMMKPTISSPFACRDFSLLVHTNQGAAAEPMRTFMNNINLPHCRILKLQTRELRIGHHGVDLMLQHMNKNMPSLCALILANKNVLMDCHVIDSRILHSSHVFLGLNHLTLHELYIDRLSGLHNLITLEISVPDATFHSDDDGSYYCCDYWLPTFCDDMRSLQQLTVRVFDNFFSCEKFGPPREFNPNNRQPKTDFVPSSINTLEIVDCTILKTALQPWLHLLDVEHVLLTPYCGSKMSNFVLSCQHVQVTLIEDAIDAAISISTASTEDTSSSQEHLYQQPLRCPLAQTLTVVFEDATIIGLHTFRFLHDSCEIHDLHLEGNKSLKIVDNLRKVPAFRFLQRIHLPPINQQGCMVVIMVPMDDVIFVRV